MCSSDEAGNELRFIADLASEKCPDPCTPLGWLIRGVDSEFRICYRGFGQSECFYSHLFCFKLSHLQFFPYLCFVFSCFTSSAMIYIRSNYAIWQLVFRSWLLGGTHGGRLTYEIGFISLRVMPLSVLPLRMITIRDGHISKRAKFLSLSTHHQMTSSTALSSTCFCHHNDTYHNFASIAPALACDVQYNLAVIRVLPTGQHIPDGKNGSMMP